MRPVVGGLRQIGICLIIYLDDTLIMHQEKQHLMQLTSLVCQITADCNSENRISGFSSQFSLSTFGLPNIETEENPAECQFSPEKGGGVSQEPTVQN